MCCCHLPREPSAEHVFLFPGRDCSKERDEATGASSPRCAATIPLLCHSQCYDAARAHPRFPVCCAGGEVIPASVGPANVRVSPPAGSDPMLLWKPSAVLTFCCTSYMLDPVAAGGNEPHPSGSSSSRSFATGAQDRKQQARAGSGSEVVLAQQECTSSDQQPPTCNER